MELLGFPLAQVIAAAKPMADAEEHLLIAEAEEIGAGYVLVDGDTSVGVPGSNQHFAVSGKLFLTGGAVMGGQGAIAIERRRGVQQ